MERDAEHIQNIHILKERRPPESQVGLGVQPLEGQENTGETQV